jgi:hypothetical protein
LGFDSPRTEPAIIARIVDEESDGSSSDISKDVLVVVASDMSDNASIREAMNGEESSPYNTAEYDKRTLV